MTRLKLRVTLTRHMTKSLRLKLKTSKRLKISLPQTRLLMKMTLLREAAVMEEEETETHSLSLAVEETGEGSQLSVEAADAALGIS